MRKLSVLLITSMLMCTVSCNNNKKQGENPFFTEWDTPFGMPPFGDIRPEHYMPAFERAMEEHLADINAIVTNSEQPGFENVILALDNSGQMLDMVGAVFGCVSGGDKTPQIKAVEEQITPLRAQHNDKISLNEALFDKIAAVYENRESLGLDELQLRLTKKTYDRFVRSGALLSPEQKDRLREINQRHATAQVEFGNNLLQANKDFIMVIDTADVEKLPTHIKNSAARTAEAAGQKGRYAFTLSLPSMLPFLTYSDRRDLRETLYKGYLERCNEGSPNDNRDLINTIVSLRAERAQLLGYATYADFVLENRMAPDVQAVYALFDQLWEPVTRTARQELEDMQAIKLRETGSSDFQSWDWWYYAEKVRAEKYSLDEEALKPYFSVSNVQAGIFELCNKLYGITFRPLSNVPVYHKDCTVYEVMDRDGSHLGVVMFDFFPREGKAVGARCGRIRARSYDAEGNRTEPITYIVCNFTPPADGRPALLSLDETTTFFHEFGHALHNLFTDVPYRGLQGTERDFVELPSQIMENWALEPAMLKRYALHYSTKTPIPDQLIEKIGNSSLFNQGFAMTEHIAAVYTDMDIHSRRDNAPLDINAFENRMLYQNRAMPREIAPRYRLPYFRHVFASEGYAAGYYGYKWAEVLDKDAYEAFAETGDLFNPDVAQAFRTKILQMGGSKDGMSLYRDFRGKDPSVDYLLYAYGLKKRAPKPVDELILVEDDVDAAQVTEATAAETAVTE